MGVNYNQRVILGICISRESVENELCPAEYVEQPQYDTNTGKRVSSKSVLKKHQEVEYQWGKWTDDCFYEFGEQIARDLHLSCAQDYGNDNWYIGFALGDKRDYGRAELLDGEVSFDELENLRAELQARLPGDNEIGIHFVGYAG